MSSLPLPTPNALYRPASFPSPTTPKPSVWGIPHHPLTPTSSLPSHITRSRPSSQPTRSATQFPKLSPSPNSPPAHPHSPLAQPPNHPAPSSPSLNVANEGVTASDGEGKGRNIVILLDGTGKQFSMTNSNVIKTLSVLEADETQLLYYSSGVGTILPDHASTWGSIRTAVAEGMDTALAWNFQDFVCNAYKYLMDFYRAGDKVYIFGFSRGAYTARALAGMIQKVGLLAPGNHNQIPLAYEVYIRPNQVATREGMSGDEELSVVYRQIFGISRTVRIEFLGLWDTVSSLGGITLPRLPYAGNVKSVKFFRQALALDERRARFAPEYRRLDPAEISADPGDCKAACISAQDAHDMLHSPSSSATDKVQARQRLEEMLNQTYPDIGRARVLADEGKMETRYLRKNVECWFMGCHSDVGGGNDLNGANSLSNIPFRWMLREAVLCGLKLEAVGVCLQPAIYLHPAVVNSGLIPAELIQILKEELRGETVEFETENTVRSLVDQHLPHGRLVEILNLATAYDSGMMSRDAMSDAERSKAAEVDRSRASEETSPGPDPRGLPIGPDGLMLGTESLKGIWWVLEGLILQTRTYTGGEGEGTDIWRANLGRPRQMARGQYIHRSVQKRLRYEHPLDQEKEEKKIVKWWKRVTTKAKQLVRRPREVKAASLAESAGEAVGTGYDGPKAELPTEWDLSWDDLRLGVKGEVIWEE